MMTVSLDGNGYSAYLVIDSIVNNTSSGGVRIGDSVPLEEVAALAREMTFKYTSYRLARGGAKMGVSIPFSADPEEKTRVLRELGWKLGPIIRTGLYNPGMDMNCGADDLRAIYLGAGVQVGAITDSSYFTALSVESGLEACYDEWGCKGAVSVAIDGFGRVAGHLAARLEPARYKIVAVSTVSGAIRNQDGFDLKTLSAKRNEAGDEVVKLLAGEVIDKEQLFTESVDILIPSSRTWVINARNVGGIRARSVVPIANAPYAEGAIASLQARGVLCLPGYITNAGGVFGSSLYDTGLNVAEVETMTKRYVQPAIRQLVRLSRDLGVSPTELAELAVGKELDVRNRGQPVHGYLATLFRRLKRYLPKAVRKQLARQNFVASLSALARDLECVAGASDRAAYRVGDYGCMDHK